MLSGERKGRRYSLRIGLTSLWLVVCAPLTAAEFWETKPFLQWSDKEVQKLMEDSPWTGLVSVPLPPSTPVPSIDAGPGGRGGGGGDDKGFGPAPLRIRVTVSWRSALPLRQAAVRSQVGQGGTVSPQSLESLARDDEFYVVGFQGLPQRSMRPGPGGALTVESFLRRSGKPPIPAAQATTQQQNGGPLLLIAFPRTDPITLDDGDVEVAFKLEQIEVKKKFKLKDMVFGGKLAL